jgi:hypothetical protein
MSAATSGGNPRISLRSYGLLAVDKSINVIVSLRRPLE